MRKKNKQKQQRVRALVEKASLTQQKNTLVQKFSNFNNYAFVSMLLCLLQSMSPTPFKQKVAKMLPFLWDTSSFQKITMSLPK
jgi:hypothetical protein